MHLFKRTKKKAKFIAAFLCVCLIMGLSMNQAGLLQFTRADDAVWSGEYPTSTKALKGQGTVTSPFLIETAADFAQFAYNVNNGMYSGAQHFKLTRDINLAGGEWIPIGDNSGHDFTGVFDGDGKKVTGLRITIGATRTEYLGLFGRTMNAQIKNLELVQCSISQSGAQNGSQVGGLVGLAEGTSVTNCRLINSAIVGNASVGGIAGSTTGSSYFTGCYIFNSTVTTTLKSVGGIAGSSKGATFLNCYVRGNSVIENKATGDVDATEQTAGGILGYSSGSVNIVNCYNNSTVKSSNIAGGIANGTSFAIRNCYNVGTVEASTGTCGSLIGSANSTVVVERSFYLKQAAEKPYPDGASVTASNVGYFVNAQSSSFLQKENVSMSWNFTENKTLTNALLEGVINYSTNYPDILQWGSDSGMVNDNYPIHTSVKGHQHDDKGKEVYSKYPTCTETGLVEKHCSKCDYFVTKTIPATGHSYQNDASQEKIITKAPTCEDTGLACWECTNKDLNNNGAVCGHRTPEQTVAALGHSWKAVTQEATCVAPGYTREECENGCGKVQNQVDIPAKGHDYVLKIEGATCTEPEKRIETCSRCEDVIVTTSGSALGHLWDNESGIEKESTCVEKGGFLRTCTRDKCGYSEFVGDRFPIAAHNYLTKKVAPTCTDAGYTLYTCKVCEVEYRNLNLLEDNNYDDYVAPKGHTYTSEVVQPTCVEDGYTRYTCIDCGHTYDVVKTGTATGNHSYRLDSTQTKIPTCLKDGVTVKVCEVCGDVNKTVVPAVGSHYFVLDEERSVKQSCTAGGYDLYQCKICLETEKRNVTAEGLGHDYQTNVVAPTCLDGGYTTTTCSRCDYKEITDRKSALGHNHEPSVVPATTTSMGYTHWLCSRCDDSYDNSYIAATPDARYEIATQTLYLSDMDELMQYSLDGVTWEAVEVSQTTVSADAINSEIGIQVKRPGNDVLPLSDSAVQVVEVARAATPSAIVPIQGANNRPGMIVGVNSTMEYRLQGEEQWHPIEGEVLENLEPGIYEIRVKATDAALASKPYIVEIKGVSDDDSSQTTPPGGSLDPSQTTPPGGSLDPSQTTPPGGSLDPSQTTPPTDNLDPSNPNNPGNNSSNGSTGSANGNTGSGNSSANGSTGSGNSSANGSTGSGNSSANGSTGTGNTSANGSTGTGNTSSNGSANSGNISSNGSNSSTGSDTTQGLLPNQVYYSTNGGTTSGKVTTKSYTAAKTGDDNNIAVYLVIIATAVSAVAIVRKKKVQE